MPDGGAGRGDLLLVVLAEFERAQHVELRLRVASGRLLIARFRGACGRELVGAKRLKLDDVGPCPRGRLHQLERPRAIAVMVNTGLGNDQGLAMHGVSSLGAGRSKSPAYQAVVLVEYAGKSNASGRLAAFPRGPPGRDQSCRLVVRR